MIKKIFKLLNEWRQLPQYQLERRADIFFALYLEDFIYQRYNEVTVDIIPEFPIKKNILKPDIDSKNKNLSTKIDYLIFTKSNNVYLIELKTSNTSVRKSQNQTYFQIIDIGFEKLYDGVIELYNYKNSSEKYEYLIQKLNKLQIIKDNICQYSFYKNPIFIKPTKTDNDEGEIITFSELSSFVSQYDDSFSNEFKEALKNWIPRV